ncbi:thymidylate synthase [Laspinema palackyanum]|uniref:thymidylate synthase n=1 Tax=Laspinema palackyanum TaxID=3231601 RepID=UPI00345C80FF|nr:thymidylate synthase [Laspinema sp. D2c]
MFRNTTQAFYSELKALLQSSETIFWGGVELKSGRSRLIKITSPRERVDIIPHLNSNIFAQIAATFWEMAGRQDLQFLYHYLPQALDFFEDRPSPTSSEKSCLKSWYLSKELQKVVHILNTDSSSRDAVINLSPTQIKDSRNPENFASNWMQFLIRNGKLHLNICLQSHDMFSGTSGINPFGLSIFQEAVASWTGTEVGEYCCFISELHLGDRHSTQAQQVLDSFTPKTLYEFGFTPPQFTTPFAEIDSTLSHWFELEHQMRQGSFRVADELQHIPDDLVRNSLELLYIYNRHQQGYKPEQIAQLIAELPPNDFKIAAVEYFARIWNNREVIPLQPQEKDYFDYLWQRTEPTPSYSFSSIFQLLSTLHYKKTLVYKNSWKKHGEALGVFAGISRKYDRLETMFTENVKPTADESVLDTFADLAVYSTKYLTYLAEHYPEMFQEFIQTDSTAEPLQTYWHNEGFDPTSKLLTQRYESSQQWQQISNYQGCFEAIRDAYKELEDIFVNNDWRVSDSRKCSLSADLAIVSLHYLVLASQQEPENFQKFAEAIANL